MPQVAENEAAAQEQLARNEMSKGIADRERQQRAAARQMGEMRANMGASGFEMDTGSMSSFWPKAWKSISTTRTLSCRTPRRPHGSIRLPEPGP